MDIWLLSAAGTSLITMIIHLTLGGREIVRPLLESTLHPVVRYTNYYCWHLVTITITATAAMFLAASLDQSLVQLGWFALLLSVAFAVLSLALIIVFRQNPLLMPQWLLFLITSILALTGLA